MNPSIRSRLQDCQNSNQRLANDLAKACLQYLDTADPTALTLLPAAYSDWQLSELGVQVGRDCSVDPDAGRLCGLVALAIEQGKHDNPLVDGFMRYLLGLPVPGNVAVSETFFIESAKRLGLNLPALLIHLLPRFVYRLNFGWTLRQTAVPHNETSGEDPRFFNLELPGSLELDNPFEQLAWHLPDDELAALLSARTPNGPIPPKLIGAVARFKPDVFRTWVSTVDPHGWQSGSAWQHVIHATDRFDNDLLEFSKRAHPPVRIRMMIMLDDVRGGSLREETRREIWNTAPLNPQTAVKLQSSLLFLSDHYPQDAAKMAEQWVRRGCFTREIVAGVVKKLFTAVAAEWSGGGRSTFQALLETPCPANQGWYSGPLATIYSRALTGLLKAEPRPPGEEIREWMNAACSVVKESGLPKREINAMLEALWSTVVEHGSELFAEELWILLGDKLKTLRDWAACGLIQDKNPATIARAMKLLDVGKVDQKLGAAAVIGGLGDGTCLEALQERLAAESSDPVRVAIRDAIKKVGGDVLADKLKIVQESQPILSLSALEAGLEKEAKKLRLPPTSWLKLDALFPLLAADGTPLSPQVVVFLIAKQSKHKTLEAAPDLLPLLAHIDREKSPPFALALVEGFLNSEQAAADRWALALGGLLGDSRIIPPLLSRIPDWCENSRHKLAEYAAQAIALLPGNEPLMVLDSLSNRYRSKFKNVGKACAEAFNAAAAARGITADELGDMVVPDFGFDGDGIRRFEWDGGGASAELGAEFKLSWFDPDTDKAWKSLPANAPTAVKDEVKTLGKLLREAVKAQTARLEMTLVRQRRWPVARWRELFENHPLLRSFASSLAWGIYDASGTLLRTFRRYPNGLLANAAGELEELLEADTMVGMIHPLELDTTALDAWRAHLARFKVKQPFPQIDRPVELMDPLHGNRREIALTKGGKVSAGTFRSRSEKRGWTRGSVVDAGGISSYYKLYPGAGVEVVLPTDNFYIGIDPMDTVELGAAYFAKAGSVERGSYTYDEPAPDDPRVLRFDLVPAVVWSETMSDLKAILGV